MVVVNIAYTEQINPQGASPILTRDQIWKGLQRKVRSPQDYLPVLKGCDVIEEKENEVVRDAHFSDGHTVREVCKSYYPSKVDFWQPDGAVIVNVVSDGPGLTEHDYNMTFAFEWRLPNIEEGSQEHKDAYKQRLDMAKTAVHSSIEALRRMAKAGELE